MFTKCSILDVWQVSDYASDYGTEKPLIMNSFMQCYTRICYLSVKRYCYLDTRFLWVSSHTGHDLGAFVHDAVLNINYIIERICKYGNEDLIIVSFTSYYDANLPPKHCIKNDHIWNFPRIVFPHKISSVNTDQKNSECGQFLCIETHLRD